MRNFVLLFVYLLSSINLLHAQEMAPDGKVDGKIKVYCEVMCVQYNLFKQDVNAVVDFGIADKEKYANGWIYNSDTDKKYSFASPMSVFKYMTDRGWEYKDAIVVTENAGIKGSQNVWHFILTKELPVGYTDADVVGNIDYRNK